MIQELFNEEIRRDLLITALEGGSNYWYDLRDQDFSKYKSHKYPCMSEYIYEALKEGEVVSIYDIEQRYQNNPEVLGKFNLDELIDAEEILLKQFPHIFANIISESYDSGDADIWFQLVVLKEVIYG